MSNLIETPVYSQIALDIAFRIAREDLKENTKVLGRSVLAGEYNVSPETIRRALRLLVDMEIVRVLPNNGFVISSRDNAIKYIDRFNTGKNFKELKNELRLLLSERDDINKKIMDTIDKIFNVSERFKNISPLYTHEFEVPENSPLQGKTINETNFWQNTHATIVAIKRDGKMILSPGPYASFRPHDIIICTGEPEIAHRVSALLSPCE